MANYYTDQDRIDAQTMRIDVSMHHMLILALPGLRHARTAE